MNYTGNYKSDREFTDIVHLKLACSIIYPLLNWDIQDTNLKMLNNIDTQNAVDYIAIDRNRLKTITIQERFREQKYSNYTDFTIRYKRDYSKHEERKLSEFFKLDADYFVYGIIDTDKYRVNEAKNFLKYCVIDVNKLKQLMDLELIVIDEKSGMKKCYVRDKVLMCPVIQNHDFSSSFIPIDILLLSSLFEDDGVIVLQDGF